MQSYDGFRAVAPVRATAAVRGAVNAGFRRMPLKIEAARIGGVEVPNQKKIEFSLQYIYGIGHTTAKAILSDTVSTCICMTDCSDVEWFGVFFWMDL